MMQVEAEIHDQARTGFRAAFGVEPTAVVVAPGRVNLLGGHVDYNDGYVLPVAIDRALAVAAGPRPDRTVRLRSSSFSDEIHFPLDDIRVARDWGDYPKGIVRAHLARGHDLGGFDAYVESSIPLGGGVSSSAAIDVAVAALLQRLFGFVIPGPEVAVMAQQADNEFVGIRCGIMDQFVSAMGKANHLLFLDCRTLAYQYVPIDLDQFRVVLIQSGVPRRLVDSEYNARRAECERGVALLREQFPDIRALRDVTPEMLEAGRGRLPEITYKRCRHVVDEIQRVPQGVEALRAGELERFGQLMYDSHGSSRDWYEVTVPELDVLVDAARAAPGGIGGRVTGAGFGGCTVHLVKGEHVEAFLESVATVFARRFGRRPDSMICRSRDGAFVTQEPAR